MKLVQVLAKNVGVHPACNGLGVAPASFYRWQQPRCWPAATPRVSPLAMTQEEQQQVLNVMHAHGFVDKAPRQIYSALLDKGTYLCSVSTMYRILEKNAEVKERRQQLRHPHYHKPELLATGPNQVWSWDITKLKGPVKWTYFYLYVIIDIFSRYVVGWMVAHRELACLAKRLIDATCHKQGIQSGQLTLHADRGSSMKSKTVALLLADLGVDKSHSRPYVSDDNPYSEAQFKTLKYQPEFPDRFGSLQDARHFCVPFFDWYNNVHYHSGIGFLTPKSVHYGLAQQIIKQRQMVLDAAFDKNPHRFKGKRPLAMEVPCEAWINKPKSAETDSVRQ